MLVKIAESPADDYTVNFELVPLKFLHSDLMQLDARRVVLGHLRGLLEHINFTEAPLQNVVIPAIPAHQLKNSFFSAALAVQDIR